MRKKYILLISIFVLMVTVGSYIGYNILDTDNETITELSQEEGESLIIGQGSLFGFSIEDLIERSDIIVFGSVEEVLPAKKGTFLADDMIYHDVIIDVEQYLFGKNGQERISVRMLGGTVDGETLIVGDIQASFIPDEQVILFLSHPPENSLEQLPEGIDKDSLYITTGAKLGKYSYKNGSAYNYKDETITIETLEDKISVIRDTK